MKKSVKEIYQKRIRNRRLLHWVVHAHFSEFIIVDDNVGLSAQIHPECVYDLFNVGVYTSSLVAMLNDDTLEFIAGTHSKCEIYFQVRTGAFFKELETSSTSKLVSIESNREDLHMIASKFDDEMINVFVESNCVKAQFKLLNEVRDAILNQDSGNMVFNSTLKPACKAIIFRDGRVGLIFNDDGYTRITLYVSLQKIRSILRDVS